jgi:anti-sigma regulatory factor (Ser/Thr protein kinase)
MQREFHVATRDLGPALDALEHALCSAGVPEPAVLELRLVAEEVLTNVAKYGHGDGAEHVVDVRLTLASGEVRLEFTDDGRPFDPLAAAPPDPGVREIGGLGIVLIRSLVDALEYARVGSSNVLSVRKRVAGPPGEVT